MPYQSFSGAPGDSDSAAKLERLRLPADLQGLSVLDVACNEGFFCMEAWRRGAARVVGIDRNPNYIRRARRRDTRTDYRVMDFMSVDTLDERFDLILLLSALHYSPEPEKLLLKAVDLLRPNGLFILECGVARGRDAEWVTINRRVGDVVRHPTHAAVLQALEGAAVRRRGRSVNQRGDPIDRYVYHVTPRKPIILLVSGPPGSGKSILVKSLIARAEITPISLDHLFVTMPSWCRNKALLDLRSSKHFQSNKLNRFAELLAQNQAEGAFVDEVLATQRVLAPKEEPALTVIEGHALSRGNFRAAFTARLKERGCYVWHVEPAPASEPQAEPSS